MNMNDQPGASGARDTGTLRKPRRPSSRGFRLNWTVHLVILGLALLIWWIARDMVAVTKTLNDQGRVRFQVSEDLEGDWRVLGATEVPVSLEVSGPNNEINSFASDLEQSPGRFAYMYEINTADIANLQPNSLHQITVDVDTRKFEPTGETIVPPELSVRPLAGDRVFRVTLEQFITRNAEISLGEGATGEVRIPGERDQREAWRYEASVELDHDIEVRGPASAVTTITDPMGVAQPKISIDVMQILENKVSSDPARGSIRRIIEGGSMTATVYIVPTPLVEVREILEQGRNGRAQTREIQQVPVRLRFQRQENYTLESGTFPVNIVMPNWLVSRGARVEDPPESLDVAMQVLQDQRSEFNEDNVRVMLDLTDIGPDSYTPEVNEETGLHRIRIRNLYFSLDINTDKLTYRFPTDSVTRELYYPLNEEISIVWTE